jgi:hypothetical protein
VSNSDSIIVFAPGDSDNIAPLRTISGAHTGLANPLGVALDHAGHLYVANILGSSVTIYALGSAGDAVPIRSVSGSRSGLSRPGGVALDSSGILYVSNIKNSTITIYEVCRLNCGP